MHERVEGEELMAPNRGGWPIDRWGDRFSQDWSFPLSFCSGQSVKPKGIGSFFRVTIDLGI